MTMTIDEAFRATREMYRKAAEEERARAEALPPLERIAYIINKHTDTDCSGPMGSTPVTSVNAHEAAKEILEYVKKSPTKVSQRKRK